MLLVQGQDTFPPSGPSPCALGSHQPINICRCLNIYNVFIKDGNPPEKKVGFEFEILYVVDSNSNFIQNIYNL